MEHEKHQYYFEKHLRNEMAEDERLAFDEKLSADASLRLAFEYYKLNRQKLLEQLIEEHNLIKKDTRLNKFIFLFISLTGMLLTFNYFVSKNELLALNKIDEKPKNIFVRYIPFMNWGNRLEKKPKIEKSENEPEVLATIGEVKEDEKVERLDPSIDGNERLASDLFIADTFISVCEKKWIDQYITYKNNLLDSTLFDSILVKPILPAKDKNKTLLVEFWKSPFDYQGYLYQGNKLILYGIAFPTDVYIYAKSDTLKAILPKHKFSIIEQPNFNAF